ncbi:MAG: sigma-54-dependent Fis family transcriptional regulator [Deltaproteobacteria bacterium]|nr:sigma-54-dependent Fis family transcriptional regulator [Deltaproteobacteria bacterium]
MKSAVPAHSDLSVKKNILIIEESSDIFSAIKPLVATQGYAVSRAKNPESAIKALSENSFDAIVWDLNPQDTETLASFVRLKNDLETSPIILVSSSDDEHCHLQAIRNGADDCIAKPLDNSKLLTTIAKSLARHAHKTAPSSLAQDGQDFNFRNIVAKSKIMLDIFETIRKIADYRTTIMIYGESGTGKELIAKAIHYNSSRRNKRFIAINCGAIPENLLESELFGHKRGAFTDATRNKKGLFEEADGGTILLDEIGELPLHLQVKLLRVLQESQIRRVGDEELISIDVRVIAATLRDLEQDVLEGRFRDDLYYRLNVISIHVPPLRERREDIAVLVNHFIKKHKNKLHLSVNGITADAMSVLMKHSWPGNIRELENCIERAMILTNCEDITVDSLPNSVKEADSAIFPLQATDPEELSIKVHSRIIEESLIRKALKKTRGNRTRAAKLLEISHRTLLYKLKEFNLDDLEEQKS